MRSGADFSDELSGAGGILGRGGAVVAGFEVDLRRPASARPVIQAGIARRMVTPPLASSLRPHLVHRAME